MAWGEYPAEYNAKVHGPYDPARWYGKPDTQLRNVKLGELAGWLGRRNKTPLAFIQSISRGWWQWQHGYMQPVRAGSRGFLQLTFGMMTFFYIINYGKIRKHRFYKHH